MQNGKTVGQQIDELTSTGTAAAPAAKGFFSPLVDKVGVPLLWFGLGYMACSLFGNKRTAPPAY